MIRQTPHFTFTFETEFSEKVNNCLRILVIN